MKNSKVLIIAEAGVNHDGSLEKAIKLIDIAAEAGADFVKFQIWDPKNFEKFREVARKKAFQNRSNLKWENKQKGEGS